MKHIYIIYKSITLHVFQNCKKLFLSFQPCSTEPVLAAWKRIADVSVGDYIHKVLPMFFPNLFESPSCKIRRRSDGRAIYKASQKHVDMLSFVIFTRNSKA